MGPIVLSLVLSICFQWLCFVPAALYETEVFYDLCGSINFLLLCAFSVFEALDYNPQFQLSSLPQKKVPCYLLNALLRWSFEPSAVTHCLPHLMIADTGHADGGGLDVPSGLIPLPARPQDRQRSTVRQGEDQASQVPYVLDHSGELPQVLVLTCNVRVLIEDSAPLRCAGPVGVDDQSADAAP